MDKYKRLVREIKKLPIFEGKLQTCGGTINSKFVDWYMLKYRIKRISQNKKKIFDT